MGAGEVTGPPAVRPGVVRATTGSVATGQGSDGDEDGRPEIYSTQARFVIAVWLAVTLVLIVIYAIVLVLL